jgi:hypothetical protein
MTIWMAKLIPLHSKMMLLIVLSWPAKRRTSLSGPPMASACWYSRFCAAVGAKLTVKGQGRSNTLIVQTYTCEGLDAGFRHLHGSVKGSTHKVRPLLPM